MTMTTRLFRAIDVIRVVRQDTRAWTQHLTGEGPATIRRQREAVTRARAASTARRAPAYETRGRAAVPRLPVAPRRYPALTTLRPAR